MYRGGRKEAVKGNCNKYECMKSKDEKNTQGDTSMCVNISYHIRKLFSYCDADILRIENNLIIYNSLIDNIKKNGNKIIKKDVEKIIREKEKNEKYCLTEMNEEEYKINNFDLKKVELDFKFIECSLCFELIKFVCVQECNHTYCFLCFYRLLYMQKKETDVENNQTTTSTSRENNRIFNNRYLNYENNNSRLGNRNVYANQNDHRVRVVDAFIDTNQLYNDRRKDGKDEKYNYEFDKNTMKCPFCKEKNEYIFFCLNNFYTYFTYDNLLHTLLEKEDHERYVSQESTQLVDHNENYPNRFDIHENSMSNTIHSITHAECTHNRDVTENRGNICIVNTCHLRKEDVAKGINTFGISEKSKENNTKSRENYSMITENNTKSRENNSMSTENNNTNNEHTNFMTKNDFKKAFSSHYDDIIILRNILKKNKSNGNDESSNNLLKKNENMYLFLYYEKYIKRKREKIKYLLNGCVSSEKRYAFYSKIFVDTEKKIFFEYFYIYSLSTLLTSYACLLSPCIEHWIQIQSKKVEKYKQNHKTDKYFHQIYVNNERDILRKKNDSIYDKYQQYTKKIHYIKDDESELSDDYFRVIDIFSKVCFTNLDNINNINVLKNYCHKRLNDLCRHMNEHNKTYCDVCVGNSDNIFLFEYNIFFKKYIKTHIENGEKIAENKFKIRHIYCHLCGFYLYDFDTFMNHINKYHFFCKFCFNKKNINDTKESEKTNMQDDIVYYDQLHLHVYKDYENLFEHYKKKHHPCLYEQCIFVVFDNKIDLCFHLAEKHEEKGSNKKNKITFSIAGASYNEIRKNIQSEGGSINTGASRHSNNIERNVQTGSTSLNKNWMEEDCVGETTEDIDVNRHKCIYNFKKFHDSWYFDYFIECKVMDFLKYFSINEKIYFLYIIMRDMEIILKIFENLCNKKKTELYFSQEEIIEVNKKIIEQDFPQDRNNFFHVKLFFDYIIEKTEYLLYNKEDLEKNYLHLFFNIIINRSFIFYYSFFYMYIKSRHIRLDKVINHISSTGNTTTVTTSADGILDDHVKGNTNANSVKIMDIFKCEYEITEFKKRIEADTNISPIKLSKYGFLYLVFFFFKIDKHGFENVCALVRNISNVCNQVYNNAANDLKKAGAAQAGRDKHVGKNVQNGGKQKSDILKGNTDSHKSSNIMIALPARQPEKVKKELKNCNTLLDAINSKCDLNELEDINQLIKRSMKRKNPNNNIINNIYDKKWDVSKKVVLDLLYYIKPNLNLVSFFYLFLSNYFSAYMKEPCINKYINISSENKKKIIKRMMSNDADLSSLTNISKNLSSFVNAKALEECLSTGPEYYRIRKDIEIILHKLRSEQTERRNHQDSTDRKDSLYKREDNDKLDKNRSGAMWNNKRDGWKEKPQREKISQSKTMDDIRLNVNLYDVSHSLRNRFLNIIKSTKVNELYLIYFYVSTILSSSNPSSTTVPKTVEEFPMLKEKVKRIDESYGVETTSMNAISSGLSQGSKSTKKNTMNSTSRSVGRKCASVGRNNITPSISSSSYKNKVDKKEEFSTNSAKVNIDFEFPPLPDQKQEEMVSQTPSKSSGKKKKVTKELSQIVKNVVTTDKIITNKVITNNVKKKKENESSFETTTKNNRRTPDFNYTNFPLLPTNNIDSNEIKNNKTKNKKSEEKVNKNKKSMSIIMSKEKTTYSHKNKNERDIQNMFNSLQNSSSPISLGCVDGNNNKKQNDINIINHSITNNVNNKNKTLKQKGESSKNKNNIDDHVSPLSSFPHKNMSYLSVSESNVTYTIKRKNKLKRCNMCTYDNPHERTRCELCESPL
ncbi:hypothetical protein, conserved [Plasmodium gonderi]|uniref:RING-type domain-containing protein n=1 Tax=Plasmodium gonderi TaxID=77519 RepID=A0A1Y1JQ66_PLAGO|nr:hypothetical protein, conserved [Plasmodium gonderi]GAW82583.1 hypothetical protein, conserved [Plasmodium gonderi]